MKLVYCKTHGIYVDKMLRPVKYATVVDTRGAPTFIYFSSLGSTTIYWDKGDSANGDKYKVRANASTSVQPARK